VSSSGGCVALFLVSAEEEEDSGENERDEGEAANYAADDGADGGGFLLGRWRGRSIGVGGGSRRGCGARRIMYGAYGS
jgi:hypothetical protein